MIQICVELLYSFIHVTNLFVKRSTSLQPVLRVDRVVRGALVVTLRRTEQA